MTSATESCLFVKAGPRRSSMFTNDSGAPSWRGTAWQPRQLVFRTLATSHGTSGSGSPGGGGGGAGGGGRSGNLPGSHPMTAIAERPQMSTPNFVAPENIVHPPTSTNAGFGPAFPEIFVVRDELLRRESVNAGARESARKKTLSRRSGARDVREAHGREADRIDGIRARQRVQILRKAARAGADESSIEEEERDDPISTSRSRHHQRGLDVGRRLRSRIAPRRRAGPGGHVAGPGRRVRGRPRHRLSALVPGREW